MQSHSSRHFVSNFLQDLHPNLGPPTVKGVVPHEIAAAYGRRYIPKLVAVLKLDDLCEKDLAHCLRVFNSSLSNQEKKNESIALEVAQALVKHLRTKNLEVVRLACKGLEGISTAQSGRQKIFHAAGERILADILTAAKAASIEATAAFKQLSSFHDGQTPILECDSTVPALVGLLTADDIPLEACNNAITTLANLASTEAGAMACLDAAVPSAINNIVERTSQNTPCSTLNVLHENREFCAECLMQLSRQAAGKVAIRGCGGIKGLGSLLGDHRVACLRKATAALMGISIDILAKAEIMDSCMTKLIGLLKHSDQAISSNARATIVSCCENPNVAKNISAILSPTELEFFLGPLPQFAPAFQ